ncbi:uncharacterized protein LOC141604644 isoform X2 [Silene latifolia]|uniref:uncharacterized protein LOC141604644 isoform X2 n=1 Tax=Silene latifolia TaxID=37657 RepID=UPI003D780D64
MVCTVEARKLNLSISSSSFPKVITSLLYEPTSLSLALIHSDSSFSLISPFSPFSINSISPQTLISPPISSACFVPLSPNPKFQGCPDDKDVVFVTAGSHNGGTKVLLRFYVMGKGKVTGGKFGIVQVGCSQNGVSFDRKLGGVIVDVTHGIKVMLCGSVNYFAVYSASVAKLMVFGVRLAGDGRRELRLVKCAVIECQFPVMSVSVSFGCLIMGEMKGVRVFPLRALVKAKVGSRRSSRLVKGRVLNSNEEKHEEINVKLDGRKLKVPNGVIKPLYENHEFGKKIKNGAKVDSSRFLANGDVHNVIGVKSNANADDSHHVTVKPRSVKLRQDSGEWGIQFVSFNNTIDEGVKSREPQYAKTKAISIQAVSPQRFLVLDSDGDLHVLHLSKSGIAQMRRVPATIKVQQLAAFPDSSANSRVWMSDGLNSAHILTMPCPDTPDNEDSCNNEEKISHYSVTEVIFTSENIQAMIAVAANAVLLLGQDSLYAYAIS